MLKTIRNAPKAVRIPDDIDVARIRARLEMSQQRFANSFGIPVETLRHWEQGWRRPGVAARAYLLVIARAPEAVLKALGNDRLKEG
jgi:putative transcriptional regulator